MLTTRPTQRLITYHKRMLSLVSKEIKSNKTSLHKKFRRGKRALRLTGPKFRTFPTSPGRRSASACRKLCRSSSWLFWSSASPRSQARPHFSGKQGVFTIKKKVIVGNRKNNKDAPHLRDLVNDTLLLVEEGEKKALVPRGFELGTSRLQDRHFTNTTAQENEGFKIFKPRGWSEFQSCHPASSKGRTHECIGKRHPQHIFGVQTGNWMNLSQDGHHKKS